MAAGIAVALSQPLRGAPDSADKSAGPLLLSSAPETTPLRVFVTADARGYIDPCGCEKGQFGGLPRRGTLLNEAKRPQDLTIDLGNFAAGQRPLDRLKLRYMLEGFEVLRYDVLVPGEGELALGEDFEKAAKALKGPVVLCANLVRASNGQPVFAPSMVKTLPSGKRVAIIGLTSPYQVVPVQYRVAPPEASLREALVWLDGKADAVIVAGFLDGKPALDLAAAFPKVALVLGGRVPKGSPGLLRRGGAPAMFVGELAQYIAWADLGADLTTTSGGQRWLGPEVPDAADAARLVERFKGEARALGEALAKEAVTAFRAEGRVGSEACLSCHQAEYASWADSSHAKAMETLRSKGEQRNAECLACHLQDVPPPAGEAASSAADRNEGDGPDGAVGCEACHGGGARHIAAVRDAGAKVPLRVLERSAMASCVRCHDAERSKAFKVGPYWEKIRHGAQPRGSGR